MGSGDCVPPAPADPRHPVSPHGLLPLPQTPHDPVPLPGPRGPPGASAMLEARCALMRMDELINLFLFQKIETREEVHPCILLGSRVIPNNSSVRWCLGDPDPRQVSFRPCVGPSVGLTAECFGKQHPFSRGNASILHYPLPGF